MEGSDNQKSETRSQKSENGLKRLFNRELLTRVLSAVILAPLVIYTVLQGGWWLTALVMLLALAMIYEWHGLWERNIYKPYLILNALTIIAALYLAHDERFREGFFVFFTALILYLLQMPGLVRRRAYHVFGLFYVFVPTFLLIWLNKQGGVVLLLLLLIVWGTDIGAYFAGRLIGGPKIAPSISPKKTWAGLIGGIVLANISFFVFMAYVFQVQPGENGTARLAMQIMLVSLVAIVAQVGDFFESWVKRKAGVKDSGRLIPGHGGVLDRVDGLITAIPAYALYVYMIS